MKLPQGVTAGMLAELIGAEVIGDDSRPVTGLNEIHKVESGDLSFVDNPKYYDRCLESAATVVLINQRVAVPEGKTLIVSQDPFADYNNLVRHYYRPATFLAPGLRAKGVADSAYIHPGVTMSEDTIIGEHTEIFPGVVIYPNTIIGEDVVVQSNTVLGGEAFYYKNRGTQFERLATCGRLLIGDRVEIGCGCTIDRGVSGDTIIKNDAKLDNHVHIAHGVEIGERCVLAAQVGVAGKTILEDDVTLWGQVGVSKSLTIGARAVVMAQSGVSKSLPGDAAYFGSPAVEARAKYREEAQLRRMAKQAGKPGRGAEEAAASDKVARRRLGNT